MAELASTLISLLRACFFFLATVLWFLWTLNVCMVMVMHVVYILLMLIWITNLQMNTMNLPFAQTVLLISPAHAILLFTWRWLPVDFSLQVHARPGGHPFLRSVPGICVHAREPAVADYQWEGGIRSARASDHEGALRHWRRIR